MGVVQREGEGLSELRKSGKKRRGAADKVLLAAWDRTFCRKMAPKIEAESSDLRDGASRNTFLATKDRRSSRCFRKTNWPSCQKDPARHLLGGDRSARCSEGVFGFSSPRAFGRGQARLRAEHAPAAGKGKEGSGKNFATTFTARLPRKKRQADRNLFPRRGRKEEKSLPNVKRKPSPLATNSKGRRRLGRASKRRFRFKGEKKVAVLSSPSETSATAALGKRREIANHKEEGGGLNIKTGNLVHFPSY